MKPKITGQVRRAQSLCAALQDLNLNEALAGKVMGTYSRTIQKMPANYVKNHGIQLNNYVRRTIISKHLKVTIWYSSQSSLSAPSIPSMRHLCSRR